MSHQISAKLQELATMTVDGVPICKLDYIATIYINNYMYFTVYRRYNNPYEIIIEDYSGDHYFHKDITIKESVSSILCLSDDEATKMYVASAVSFGHNADIHIDILNYTWTQMASGYSGVYLKLTGILGEFKEACNICSAILTSNDVDDYFPEFAAADEAAKGGAGAYDELNEAVYSVSANLIVIPPAIDIPHTPKRAQSDHKELSMRHSDIKKRRAEAVKKNKELLAEERKKNEKSKRKRMDINDDAENKYMLRSKRKRTE